MAKLQWRDSEDVYQPTVLPIRDFFKDIQELFLPEQEQSLSQQQDSNLTKAVEKHKYGRMSVFVTDSRAISDLTNHLTQDPYNETGGVLVGQAYFCPETKTYYTQIVGSIAAPYTVGNRVHFKFTPECWQSILRNQAQDFPGTTIVGWYHSHPGHGIFLSGTDLNTQRLSFKQPWHIAVVYDPLQKQIGYFYGKDGKPTKRVLTLESQEINRAIDNRNLLNSSDNRSQFSEQQLRNNEVQQEDNLDDESNLEIDLDRDFQEIFGITLLDLKLSVSWRVK